MRKSMFCTVTTAAMAAGGTLLMASGAQGMPPIGLKAAVHEASAVQQVRDTCRRGHRCYYVSRPHVYVSRPHARYAEPSDAWQYSPLNTPYYWGGGAMGGGR